MSTTSQQSMKNKLALIFVSSTLAVSAAIPALAYAAHEHPFHHNERIKSMTQIEGNGYCRNLFQQLKATGDLGGGFDPNRVNHVWAHIENGDCIANT
ncbi:MULTISPECIES: hypothetical protein [unclassified Tolypothrix]|uniref:hypothetical protein n=1 Tax=unclassified Tolypothrix TaxID=2649714 RepID=UPI000A42A144|nr:MULTISPECIES: hypothetical protein [unclassified Tolypothrix]MBE9081941.1 hypothetical protein [Tolypothrix sp. LEGE 11397]UYD27607.1 hypothetical protein HGR01_05930 [Tolypothrix sp. PCC 7712]UYD36530.1 hypothetical protein HG267_12765 [Tolypothrix sp. PCC 7601]BAY93819.1 hypothetical protein NIES3275_58610 [Microchaete diplosiphon NIES-3275]